MSVWEKWRPWLQREKQLLLELALMLLVDRLLLNWQARAFRDPQWRAEALLAAATGVRR